MRKQRVDEWDGVVIRHLETIADWLQTSCPQSVIDWNRSIDVEVEARRQGEIDEMNARNNPQPQPYKRPGWITKRN